MAIKSKRKDMPDSANCNTWAKEIQSANEKKLRASASNTMRSGNLRNSEVPYNNQNQAGLSVCGPHRLWKQPGFPLDHRYVCTLVTSQVKPSQQTTPDHGGWSSPSAVPAKTNWFRWALAQLPRRKSRYFHTGQLSEEGAGPSDVLIQVKPIHICLREWPPGTHGPLSTYCSSRAKTLF